MNICRRIIPIFIVRSKNYNTFSKNTINSIVNRKSSKLFFCAKVFYCKDIMETQNISKEDLKKRLTPIQYHVTQEKGTERPFSGKFNKTYDKGMYSCIVCGQELFSSDTKYDSGCGWPAFNDVLDKGLVKLSKDTSNGEHHMNILAFLYIA
ncbi:hypothetical protein O3M35_010876 [Rhynocoris fuscipes]|uniref:peptide-methionine (R)-S-oxide reductase n=1 Tax=Rhynocoris fuscipes TaxID=488301 RepID=A0AAW1D0M6_9HEMI